MPFTTVHYHSCSHCRTVFTVFYCVPVSQPNFLCGCVLSSINRDVMTMMTKSVHSPMDPVPSMIADTVASALALPCRHGCVPRSAETAVVMREYGPFTTSPVISSSTAVFQTNDFSTTQYKVSMVYHLPKQNPLLKEILRFLRYNTDAGFLGVSLTELA